ncbi:MaoC family dehydratase N-terminal domain-containing protein [Azoarcus sp. DN11]|uniref:FAS1-like dehydratase domain-containing protein n=1 Tax=Azoarcus sp. DN11 TaxID=356837 RepID=UPI000EAFFA03|nr:MaoC family dehydratase N-terminal domain-containing protein [Azoarcus sp. DN11]AYH43533.1 hypothetical protein CDA09_09080 [Azoarcus sp. DN11]
MNSAVAEKARANATDSSLDERLSAFVGKGGERFTAARDVVTREGIRKMIEVVGDRNPVYRDVEFAAHSVHGAIVAPPGSLISWWQNCFEPVASTDWVDEQGIRHFRLDPLPARGTAAAATSTPYDEALRILASAGYTSVAGVGGELRIKRYPCVGDRLSYSDQRLESLVGPKRTGLGTGYFPTRTTYVRDQHGHAVAEIRLSSIIFAPSRADDAKAPVPRPAVTTERPVLHPGTARTGSPRTLTAADMSVGETLPSLIVEGTPSLIIAGALFNNDAMDVHHDSDWARRRGFEDVFMNTMTTQGLVTRFVNDWAGPEAVVEHLTWRLGRQQYPHDTLYVTGKVVELASRERDAQVTVEVVCSNSLGVHATCVVKLGIPVSEKDRAAFATSRRACAVRPCD